MQLKMVIFLCILAIVVGLYSGSSVYAIGDVQEANSIPQGLLDENVSEKMKCEVLEKLKQKLTIRLLQQNKRRVVKKLPGYKNIVTFIAFSPDGKVLASVSDDSIVRLCDVDTGTVITTFPHQCRVESIAFSPDGKVIASLTDDGITKLWDVDTGTVIKTFPRQCWLSSIAFNPDGKVLASKITGEDSFKLLDVDTGTAIKTLTGHGGFPLGGTEAFSPDGKVIASGFTNGTIKLWNVNSGTVIKTLRGHRDYVHSVAFSPDGKVLASGSGDNTIKLWDVDIGIEIKTLTDYGDRVHSVAFSPDGKIIASGSNDNTIKLWHLYDEEDEQVLEILRNSVTKLDSNQKMLLYALYVNNEAAEKENPVKCKVKLQEMEDAMKENFKGKSVPAMLNLAESYRSLPSALKKVVKDYFGIIE